MKFTQEKIDANAAYFQAKLDAYCQLHDVAAWAKREGSDRFLLLDVRGRDAFAKGHVDGALCVPVTEIQSLAGSLPKDRELVTFCWNHL